MPSNNFDGPVLIDNGVGTPTNPGGYFGFGRAPKGQVSTGPRLYAGTGDPNGLLVAPQSSLYLQTAGITGTLFIASDSFGTWTTFATDVDVAAILAAIAVLQGQIVAINAQIAVILTSITTLQLAQAATAANLANYQALLASASGAAHIGTSSGQTVQAVLDSISAQPVTGWSPLIPQSPADAKTDYFSGSSLNPRWTTWNPGANTTVTVSPTTRLTIAQPTHGAAHILGGIVQPVPAATRYAVTGWFRQASAYANFASGGLLVGADLIGSPATAPFVGMGFYTAGAGEPHFNATNWSDYQTLVGGAGYDSNIQGLVVGVQRMFIDTIANTIQYLLSYDGLAWLNLASVAFGATAMGAAPSTMGYSLDNDGTGAPMTLYSAMFRVDVTTNPYLPCGGFA